MKYLLVLLVVGVGIWMLSARFRKGRAPRADLPAAAEANKSAAHQQGPSQMVACAHCGVHLPADEAVHEAHSAFCSDAHRRAGPR